MAAEVIARKVYKFLDPQLDRQIDELVRRVNAPLGGQTVTVAIAKLTSIGVDGSLTFTDGVLTAHVPAS